ncbi:MAG: FG-GAP-like repeat-containing protein [Kofleriaceae bacterium]
MSLSKRSNRARGSGSGLVFLSAALFLSACLDADERADTFLEPSPPEPAEAPTAGDGAAVEAPTPDEAVPEEDQHEEAPPAPSKLAPGPVSKEELAPQDDCKAGQRCEGATPSAMPSLQNLVGSGRRGRGANSQLAVPHNITLADVDADGVTDFVQTAQNRLFVSHTDFDKTGVLHLYLRRSIKRVLTGDFHGDGYDQTCVIQDDNALACYGISTDKRALWWWFTQGSFIGDNDDFIVGDFTGDGRDDVLVYPRGGGAWRMYSIPGSYFFSPTAQFAPGNLGTAAAGLQVRAGDFNADGRDDLALINSWGQFLKYSSVWTGTEHTFWWSFTTNTGIAGTNDQVTIARVDDDNDDDVVLHDRVTGATRFRKMEWQSGALPAITNVSTGQISTSGNSLLFWAAMHPVTTEPGAARRDDAMVYELSWNGFVRSDARWSGTQHTYWWAYTQYAPNNHTGWPSLIARPWLLLKCKFSDIATTPATNQFYRDLVFGPWGLAHYWMDASYGAWDAYGSTVKDTWYGMSVTNATWTNTLSRWDRAGACINAYGGSTAGFVNTISLVNGEGDAGNAGGRVLMTPNSSNSTFLAHETGHTFGYEHSWDDSGRQAATWSGPGEYWDHWDIMSAMNVYGFTSPLGVSAGPGLNAPYANKMSFIPAHRRVQLNQGTTAQSTRLNLAAVGRPEANGSLYVRIGANNADHYTLEFRMKSAWDQGIPRDTVLLHRVLNGRSYLITGGGVERLPGSSAWFWGGTRWVSVVVNGFSTARSTADVTINY